jgi:HSP20 family protein
MPKKQQKHVEKKKLDITAHKAEPHLASHTDEWYVSASDIFEYENEVIVEMDMPGVSKDDVDMKLRENEIVVTGHVVHGEDRDDEVLYREYDEGHFHRHFVLNDTIDTDKISSVMAEGVLRIVLPKKQAYKQRQIEVKAG